MDKIHSYLTFSHFLGIGPMRFQSMVDRFGSPGKAYGADRDDLREVLDEKLLNKFIEFRKSFDPVRKEQELRAKGINIIIREDDRYPPQLLEISDAPICLYVKGTIDVFDFKNEFFFSIVGTRRPSAYGQQITSMFASELVESGAVIVSGLALGVDAVAHQSAINAGGRTIAFLGCGVDLPHPPSNRRLYESIIEKKGLVISEFPPGMLVQKGLFVARNRLISGLSKGTLIIEGLKDSGALITARYAAEQGKEVFAPPIPITSELSQAPNILLRQGAILAMATSDILETFNMKAGRRHSILESLTGEEKQMCEVLHKEPMILDDLSIVLQRSTSQLLSQLSLMELKGLIEKGSDGIYRLVII